MSDIILALIGIAVLANLSYTIWSFFSLKRVTSLIKASKTENRFILDHVVHTRSSINVLYATGAIMVFVLGFFGFNIQKNVTAEIKREIAAASSVDLDTLASKVESISLMESLAKQHADNVSRTSRSVSVLFDNMRKTPQKLFVIKGLEISKLKSRYTYEELMPVDGTKIPRVSKAPVILWIAYDKEYSQIGGIVATATEKGIEAYFDGGSPYMLDLWIYIS